MPDLRSATLKIASELPVGDPTRRKLLASLQKDATIDAYGDNILDLVEEWLGAVLNKYGVGYDDLYHQGRGKYTIEMSADDWDDYAPSQTIYSSWQVEVSLFGKAISVKDSKGRKTFKKFSVDLFSTSAADIAKIVKSSWKHAPAPVSPHQPDTPSLQDSHSWHYTER